MEILQGTISAKYKCRPYYAIKNFEEEKLAGLLFYKPSQNFLAVALAMIALLVSLYIWYQINFIAALVLICISIAGLLMLVNSERGEDEKNGIKYLVEDILEVKILDNDTTTSYGKSGAASLTGAAGGGVLLGGAGAVVGAISSGNKQNKEQIVRIGIKFVDENWVVLQCLIDETMMGRVNKSNLSLLLEMTTSKQKPPF